MSSSNAPTIAPPLYSFQARSEDPAVELFLIDARMRLVARGRRELSTSQPPGVYTLKLRAGPATREEIIILDHAMTRVVEPLQFTSAVPLEATAQTHEYHQAAASAQSKKVNVQLGTGSSLFVFAREWTPDSRQVVSNHHPAEGLSLSAEGGTQLVDFHSQSDADLMADPWAACRVDLKPGIYRLGVRVATGECFEMSLPTMPQFFTKVFLLQRGESASHWGRRPDLARASVLLSRKEDFDKDSADSRIAEMAKLALVDRRKVYSSEMDQMLSEKWENPMLGIFGAHILLLEEYPNLPLLQTVVNNLRAMLPIPHPDVESLALAAGLGTTHRFAMPPMLRQSWQIVLDHSARQPDLVRSGSLAASIATLVTQQDPWLIWRRPGTQRQIQQQEQGFASFIKARLQPAMLRRLTQVIVGKNKPGVPELDKLVRQLNIPPASVARLAETVLQRVRNYSAAKSAAAPASRKVIVKAAVRKRALARKAVAKKSVARKAQTIRSKATSPRKLRTASKKAVLAKKKDKPPRTGLK